MLMPIRCDEKHERNNDDEMARGSTLLLHCSRCWCRCLAMVLHSSLRSITAAVKQLTDFTTYVPGL